VAIELIAEAVSAGARRHKACAVLGITVRTLQRWESARQGGAREDQRKAAGAHRTPGNKLSEPEQQTVLAICNQPEYASLPPSQIVPLLADQGIYVASESTFYRKRR
jgi:putative transposase